MNTHIMVREELVRRGVWHTPAELNERAYAIRPYTVRADNVQPLACSQHPR